MRPLDRAIAQVDKDGVPEWIVKLSEQKRWGTEHQKIAAALLALGETEEAFIFPSFAVAAWLGCARSLVKDALRAMEAAKLIEHLPALPISEKYKWIEAIPLRQVSEPIQMVEREVKKREIKREDWIEILKLDIEEERSPLGYTEDPQRGTRKPIEPIINIEVGDTVIVKVSFPRQAIDQEHTLWITDKAKAARFARQALIKLLKQSLDAETKKTKGPSEYKIK